LKIGQHIFHEQPPCILLRFCPSHNEKKKKKKNINSNFNFSNKIELPANWIWHLTRQFLHSLFPPLASSNSTLLMEQQRECRRNMVIIAKSQLIAHFSLGRTVCLFSQQT